MLRRRPIAAAPQARYRHVALSEPHAPAGIIHDRLRDAPAVTAALVSEVIGETCHRLPSAGRTEPAAQIERLIASEAWTDAALALLDLELPQWQVRRIAYDEGEWHCALSRQRELPEWLDQSIEARHADLRWRSWAHSWKRRPSVPPPAGPASRMCRAKPMRSTNRS